MDARHARLEKGAEDRRRHLLDTFRRAGVDAGQELALADLGPDRHGPAANVHVRLDRAVPCHLIVDTHSFTNAALIDQCQVRKTVPFLLVDDLGCWPLPFDVRKERHLVALDRALEHSSAPLRESDRVVSHPTERGRHRLVRKDFGLSQDGFHVEPGEVGVVGAPLRRRRAGNDDRFDTKFVKSRIDRDVHGRERTGHPDGHDIAALDSKLLEPLHDDRGEVGVHRGLLGHEAAAPTRDR